MLFFFQDSEGNSPPRRSSPCLFCTALNTRFIGFGKARRVHQPVLYCGVPSAPPAATDWIGDEGAWTATCSECSTTHHIKFKGISIKTFLMMDEFCDVCRIIMECTIIISPLLIYFVHILLNRHYWWWGSFGISCGGRSCWWRRSSRHSRGVCSFRDGEHATYVGQCQEHREREALQQSKWEGIRQGGCPWLLFGSRSKEFPRIDQFSTWALLHWLVFEGMELSKQKKKKKLGTWIAPNFKLNFIDISCFHIYLLFQKLLTHESIISWINSLLFLCHFFRLPRGFRLFRQIAFGKFPSASSENLWPKFGVPPWTRTRRRGHGTTGSEMPPYNGWDIHSQNGLHPPGNPSSWVLRSGGLFPEREGRELTDSNALARPNVAPSPKNARIQES